MKKIGSFRENKKEASEKIKKKLQEKTKGA